MKRINKILLIVVVFLIFVRILPINGLQYSEKEAVAAIEDSLHHWMEQTYSFTQAKQSINRFRNYRNDNVQRKVKEANHFLNVENSGYDMLKQAESLFLKEDYISSMVILKQIDPEYSQYFLVDTLYSQCQEIILVSVSQPTVSKEYVDNINYLDSCIQVHQNKAFIERKQALEAEYTAYKLDYGIINKATKQYKENRFKTSFETLEKGINLYPDSVLLKQCLNEFHELYIVQTAHKVKKLIKHKKYNEAIRLLEDCQWHYDATEFSMMIEIVKERKNPIYKMKNDIVRSLDKFYSGWKTEEYSVQKLAADSENYIVKSGKKVLLGDYSNEKVTLLSLGTNILMSISGMDLLFDIRDLSYDLVHWGEDECFLLYLATDVIALVPVLGMIKYADNSNQVIDHAKNVTKNTENIKNAVNCLDAVIDASKGGKRTVDEVVHQAINLAKKKNPITKSISEIRSKYAPKVKTINDSLAGKKHWLTKVKFVTKIIKLADGTLISATVPVFKSFYDVKLPKDLWIKSDSVQFRECNKQLYETIAKNKKLRSLFNDEQIELLKQGKTPKGYTWHHNEKRGLMQLADKEIHDKTAHTGGRFFWGGGTKCHNQSCS